MTAPVRILMLAACLFVLPACAQRQLHITSDPPGALVHLNDEEVGRTPLSIPFTFYGTYDVRLQHEGYQSLWTERRARAPWWDHPGLDLLGEALGWRADIDWHFQLDPAIPADQIDEQAMLERAEQLRQQTVDDQDD